MSGRLGSILFFLFTLLTASPEAAEHLAYVIQVRDDIMPPMAYLVRRGVKEAMKANADTIILDMDTDGGRIDVTEEIIESLSQFKGRTVTYVNRKAFSAGSFIAVATQKIFMAPQSVIGAAAPIMLAPGGGVQDMPETVQAKMTSAVRSLVRTRAEKNGYNIDVVEAMIDKNHELKLDGEVLNEKGQILTLTNVQAEKKYGEPAKGLISSGTVDSLDDLLAQLGYKSSAAVTIEATGMEKLARWLTAISGVLLIIGAIGVYVEIKTPGFGMPGIVGICAFLLYFLGGYVAGLSGLEWLLVFFVGLACLVIELFVFPGTMALGVTGACFMLAALVMAMVDVYPGMPAVPTMPQLRQPVTNVFTTLGVAIILILVLSRYLVTTPLFSRLVSQSASGARSTSRTFAEQSDRLGQVGTTISPLRPGGKAQFGSEMLDVVAEGEMLEKGEQVKIIGFSGREPIVTRASIS